MKPFVTIPCAAVLAVVPLGATRAATQGAGDAVALRVSVRATGASALDSGAIPSGASATAPGDYEIHAEAASAEVTLGTLAGVSAGPLGARIRAVLGRELSEATAAAQSVEVVVGGALGVGLTLEGAVSGAIAQCDEPAANAALHAVLEGAELTVLGLPVTLAAHAAPNTVVPLLLPGARLVLNEQRVVDGAAEVAALHLTLDDALLGGLVPQLVDADIVVARSRASLAGCGTYVDADADGIADDADNCASHANAGQLDSDGDGAGDACDVDDDADLVPDGVDTCPLEANPAQGPCPDALHADGFE